jgi:TPR repeat protein
MAHDVFISYSSKDKTTGDAVCAMLESEGIRCWIAPRDVTPSMEWSECIIDAIQECRIMVLVFTTSSNESPQIHREIERAVNHGVAVLPFRTEDILPDKALEYFIGDVHWLDALTVPLEAHLKNLAETVKMLLAKMPPVLPMTGTAPSPGQVAETAAKPFAPNAEIQTADPSLNRAAEDFTRSEFAKAATPNPVHAEIPPQQRRMEPAPVYVAPAAATTRAEIPPARTKLLGVVVAGVLIIIVGAYFVLRNSGTSKPQVSSAPANNAGGNIPQAANATPQTPTSAPTSAAVPAATANGSTDWTTQSRDSVEAAAKSGKPEAEYEMGDRYYSGRDGGSTDNDEALKWFHAAAAHGSAKAQNQLGNIYSSGRDVAQDFPQAFAWYNKAAEQGLPEAQTSLGFMYDNGEGVAKNSELADAWFRKAAEQGFAPGQYDLALAYEEGKGVPQNYQEASEWYRKAAEQDNINAITNLGFLYENGRGVPKDYAQSMAWYRKAAGHGNALAQFNIGEMYEDGLGVPRDISQARVWYQKAADQGYANAVKKLAALKGK